MSQHPPYPPAGYPQPGPTGAPAYTAAGFGLLLAIATAWGSFMTFDTALRCTGRCAARAGVAHVISLVCAVGLGVSALLLLVGAVLIFVRQTAGAVLTAIGAFLPLLTAVLFVSIPLIWHDVVGLGLGPVVVLVGVTALVELVLSVLPPSVAVLRHSPLRAHLPVQAPYGWYPPPGRPPGV